VKCLGLREWMKVEMDESCRVIALRDDSFTHSRHMKFQSSGTFHKRLKL